MQPINVITLFSGYDSQCMALDRLGIPYDLIAWSEIDKAAIKAHNTIYPQYADRNLGDVAKIDWGVVNKPIDLLTYSSPCFVAGTLVLTKDGYKPIEAVTTDDWCLTHNNRFCRVVKIGHKPSPDIFRIKGMMFDEITCTGNHPFYTRLMYRYGHKSVRMFDTPKWTEAKDLTKKHYCGYAINQESALPQWNGVLDNRFGHGRNSNKLTPLFNNASFWYLMGRYVGDGWKKKSQNAKGIIICCSDRNRSSLIKAIDECGFHKYLVKDRTVDKCVICGKELCEFVTRYGYYAHGKRIDADTLNLPRSLLKRFLDGLIDSDGCYTNNEFKISTVSKELAYGISQCVAKVYHIHSKLGKYKRAPQCIIEGRVVNQRDTYTVSWHNEKRKQDHAFYEDGYIWFPISLIEKTNGQQMVYNLEVDDDHTYTANGTIVHNCTDFSQAGRQAGGEKGSGTRSSLLWECERAISALHPKYLLLENVAALVSEKFMPLFQRWLTTLQGYGYNSYFEVLNAKDYGVPQNRERVFCLSKLESADSTPYYFPKPFKLKKRLKDVLEQDVDERYYLSEERVPGLLASTAKEHGRGNHFGFSPLSGDEEAAATITTTNGGRKTDNFIAEPRVRQVGNIVPTGNFDNPQRGRIYDADGISPCLTTENGGNLRPKNITVGNIYDNTNGGKAAGIVLSEEGIWGALRAGDNWKVATCAMRGRDKDNPNDRGRSTENYQQRLEIGSEDTANTITTVAKDSMVVEQFIISPGHGYFEGRESDETAPTVKCSAMQAQHFVKEQQVLGWSRDDKGNVVNRQPVDVANCVTVAKRDNTQNYVKETTMPAEPQIIEDFYRTVREPRTFSDASPCLRAERTELKVILPEPRHQQDAVIRKSVNSERQNCEGIRIRRLSERELYRLMDLEEHDIDTLLASDIARTQHAKLAGNSIVVACLEHIFRRLFIDTEPQHGEQMKLF